MAHSDLSQEIERLKQENSQLIELVTAKGLLGNGQKLLMCGYLNKYSERPGSWLAGLLNKEWNLRFFCLYGNTLQYFKTEKDMLGHPRGYIDLQGARIETEGRKRGHYWTFNVVKDGARPGETISLVRCSTESQNTADHWLTKLKAVGCPSMEAPDRAEPPPIADVRYKEDGMKRSSSAHSLASSDTGGPLDRSATPPPGMHYRGQESRPAHSGYTSQSEMSDAGTSSSRHVTAQRQGSGGSPTERRGASTVVHRVCQPSPLSSERISYNFEGLRNLIMVLFAATTIRLMIENFLKYGIRINPKNWVMAVLTPEAAPEMLLLWMYVFGCIGLIWGVTRGAEALRKANEQAARASTKKGISPATAHRNANRFGPLQETVIFLASAFVIAAELGIPVHNVLMNAAVPVIPGFILILVASVVFLKLVSYVHCNWDLRSARRNNEIRVGERGSSGPVFDLAGNAVRYPENLTLNNLLYFLAAPTLVYQVAYPRSQRFRIRWVIKRMAELVVVSMFGLIVTEQYVSPAIVNSYGAFNELRYLQAFERLLKLSVPTLWGWLVVFYTLFHLLLNITAEFTGFGDREFYLAWWNAESIGEYWTLWNMPVHHWMIRHVYIPTKSTTGNRYVGVLASFFVSAIFHEVLIAVPLHRIKGYAFFGMLAQVPMVIVTEWLKRKLKKPFVGNVIFWISFCIIGQPLCMIMYYHDYVHFHMSQQQIPIPQLNMVPIPGTSMEYNG